MGHITIQTLQISNVVFENAEIGVILDTTSFVTVSNVTFTSSRPRSSGAHPYTGAKGIWLKVGEACAEDAHQGGAPRIFDCCALGCCRSKMRPSAAH
jgi:hypothetical protein